MAGGWGRGALYVVAVNVSGARGGGGAGRGAGRWPVCTTPFHRVVVTHKGKNPNLENVNVLGRPSTTPTEVHALLEPRDVSSARPARDTYLRRLILESFTDKLNVDTYVTLTLLHR